MPYINVFIFSIITILAGVSVALQQVLNSNLRIQLASPWWAGFVSYFVGLVVMLCIALLSQNSKLNFTNINLENGWFAWTSGIFGAIFIATAILMVPRLGAATVIALIVVGQMFGSMIFDHFGMFGLTQHSITPIRLAGVTFLLLGVILVRV